MKYFILVGSALCFLALSLCSAQGGGADFPGPEEAEYADPENPRLVSTDEYAQATFAGGCFWCVESPFEKLNGVVAVISGYTGGPEENPLYEQVWRKQTGHREAVIVIYDAEEISYKELLAVYWQQFDPTDAGGSFGDRGLPYTSGIWYHDEEQKRLAEESRQFLDESGVFDKPIVTPIEPAAPFYRAETYHQDFYRKSTVRYRSYRVGSGRDAFIKRVWGKRGDFWDQWLSTP